jgi:hypothetical protein
MKIRESLAPGDYKDPGPYKNPQGTVAYEIENPQAPPQRKTGAETSKASNVDAKAVRPVPKRGHKGHH